MGSPEPFVRLESVSKSYGSGPSRHTPLRSIEFVLPRGQITSLVGPSGSGKSTLLSLIAGLVRPDSGSVTIDGQRSERLDDAGRARLRADRIGIVLQADNLIPFLTAVENVELAMGFAPRRHRSTTAAGLLAELGLGNRQHHRPRELSGGEAQRVAVAMALVNEPDLLLADEVVGQLDAGTAAQVLELVFRSSAERGLTVLYVTHDEDLARRAQASLRLAECQVVRE